MCLPCSRPSTTFSSRLSPAKRERHSLLRLRNDRSPLPASSRASGCSPPLSPIPFALELHSRWADASIGSALASIGLLLRHSSSPAPSLFLPSAVARRDAVGSSLQPPSCPPPPPGPLRVSRLPPSAPPILLSSGASERPRWML